MQSDRFSPWEKLGDGIHVWHASLDRHAPGIASFEAILSADEKARADRFRFEQDRNRFIVARGILRKLLTRYSNRPPADLEFSYGQHGKPALCGAKESSALRFNLAHSGALAVYAFAYERNLGIDVERIRPESAGDDIAARYFSAREVADLKTLRAEERLNAFFDCWTRKEAYLKALGTGLQTPLDSFSVSLSPGQPAEFLGGVESRWHLAALHPGDGYAAAIVYDGNTCSLEYFSSDLLPE